MKTNLITSLQEHHILADDHTLVKAPAGYDCIIAQGRTEPDPKGEKTLKFEGKEVVVPTGKPVNRAEYSGSRFSQSEYLVYKESQVRIRYLIKAKFGW